MNDWMTVRVILAAVLVGLLAASAGAARARQPLDVELAVDATGSMGPSIHRIQRDATKLVTYLRTHYPGARVAVVQFKDADDTPEYEVLQAMTGDAKLVAEAVTRIGAGGGGDNPEAYNVVFRNSYADKSIGWRAQSRKLVVVVGDAEPHGAGAAAYQGCLDASADPHALRTRQELIGMRVNGRSLLIVRQGSTATVALQCYESLADSAYQGGGARDAEGDLTGAIEALVARAARVSGITARPGPKKPRRSTPTSPRPTPTPTPTPTPGTGDRVAPVVKALRSGGYSGTTIRLLYRVRDNSGRSSDKISVLSAGRILSQSRWAPYGPATGKAYYFDFPASSSMHGSYSFCVQSKDPSGNVSRPSCAPLFIG
jgi:hypothetical protein